MSTKFGFKKNSGYVAVPSAFIDNYAGEANPSYVVIYLCALRAADMQGSFDYGYFADKVGIKESSVKKAFQYWEKNNVIRINDGEIEFLDITDNSQTYEETEEKEELSEEKNLKSKPKKNDGIILTEELFPNYTNEDFEKFCEEGNICKSLINMAEKQLYGRQITFDERNLVLALHYSLGFSLDVLAVLFSYCGSNHKTGRQYIKKFSMDWYDKKIDTSEKAEKYLSRFDEYGIIMKILGINEEPTQNEAAKIEKWIKEYSMSPEVIKKGCEKTVENTMPNRKGRFAYADKIFSIWHKEGIKTLTDISKKELEYMEEKKQKNLEKLAKPKNKNEFTNYEDQREFVPDDDYERQQEMLKEILTGGNNE